MTIFSKIISGEIPCNKVDENENFLAFHDINPKAPVHILIIPKIEYKNFQEVDPEIIDRKPVGVLWGIHRKSFSPEQRRDVRDEALVGFDNLINPLFWVGTDTNRRVFFYIDSVVVSQE